ncbi:DUF748 domain-containing protein [Haliea sp. E1-2-M8]|uniref:DUF748 domain-containing protein n=1 Tax=Haliea sp. E1-2-M8 TaxID=3064706 RepID=UPI00271CFB93|nr:DUF748 domain-containing protein [Haliea sp. E1-2-M8]MDO8860686.1 DUF748 domain-containing protein [Haliea sp. E1-2-M8]
MRTAIRGLVYAYAAYLAITFLILLPALNFLPPWLAKEYWGRDLTAELVLFNPFTLALEIRKGALAEPDGSRFLDFDRAEVNLSLATLTQPGLALDTLALEELYLHLQRNADGSFNISDLLASPPEAEEEPPTDTGSGELPALAIGALRLSAERIEVSDHQHPDGYNTHLDGLQLAVTDLSTVAEAGQPYRLQARGEGGGQLQWQGDLSIASASSAGSLELDDIDLRPVWRFAEPWLAFELDSSRLNLSLQYSASWQDTLDYTVTDGNIELIDTRISPRDGERLPDTGVALATLRLADISVDGSQQMLGLGRMTADGLNLRGWSEGGQVSLAELFAMPAAEDESETATDSPWRLQLGLFELRNSEVAWRSEFTEPGLLTVRPLTAELRDLHWPTRGASPLTLSLQINQLASLDVEGSVDPGAGNAELDFALEGLPLAWFGPNLPSILRAEISSGEARSSGRITLAEFQPATVAVDGAVADFAVVLQGAEDALTRWDNLHWKGLAVAMQERSINLAELHLEGYEGRLHIQEDGSINVQRLLEEEAGAAEEDAPGAGAEAEAEAEVTAEAEPEAGAGEQAPWQFSVPAIFIADSALDFQDKSLPIQFRTVIGGLDGTITNLNSDPTEALEVDLKGSVDGYAPVTLTGTASPLQSPPALDLDLNFRGLDMSRLTPYSATYAGYAIERGTLNAQLGYGLENNRLQGDNRIVIEQLKLGEQVASDKALDLPLRLGIALLTDSKGVIDLAVPVSGDVNNPKFSLGSVIAGAFVNLLTKAITSPFSLLASLVGSSEDLQTVDFAAGGSELDSHSQTKLRDLASAMQQRPALRLVISGRIDPETDRARLQEQLLQETLLEQGLTTEDISQRSEAWKSAIAERYAALDTGTAQDPEQSAPSLLQQARILRDQWPVPDSALQALASERAASSERFLVNEGAIDPERVVVAAVDTQAEANTFSGVELAVDT